MKTPDYLSYDRYKKKKVANPNRRMFIFISTFLVTLVVFTFIAKAISPNVDVSIGDDPQAEPKETGLGVKKFIDERLKMIQRDDEGDVAAKQSTASGSSSSTSSYSKKSSEYNDQSFDNYSKSLDEKMDSPIKKNSSAQKSATQLPAPRPSNRDLSTPYSSGRSARVYVGRYSTMEQAKVAQEILSDSGLGISPTVKDVGGAYTLQVGSYSNRSKAEGVASELQRNNFPARVSE